MKGLVIKDLYILKGTIATTLTILTILIVYCLLRGYGIGLVIIPTLIFAAKAGRVPLHKGVVCPAKRKRRSL